MLYIELSFDCKVNIGCW